ncbi:UNVERIFIED_CONTAM: hypothetical protein H355_009976 [Colinus virginianus]|nr:hypothetical protein H355_009976 [Colinus virginianus]
MIFHSRIKDIRVYCHTHRVDDDLSALGKESLLSTFTREQHPGEKMEWQLGKIMHTQRNFFGPVDRKQLHWGFQHMLRSNIKVAQQKWNFDFL